MKDYIADVITVAIIDFLQLNYYPAAVFRSCFRNDTLCAAKQILQQIYPDIEMQTLLAYFISIIIEFQWQNAN
jgi:hypothetical protein